MDPQPIPYATPTRKGTPPPGGVPTTAPVGWRTAAGAAWLAGVVIAASAATSAFLGDQQTIGSGGLPMSTGVRETARLIGLVFGPAVFALAVGASAAVVLFFWTCRRLAWVAALPILAGLASAVGLARSWAGFDAPSVAGMVAVVAVQAGLIYAGTHLGRPLARWLTRQLVPPALRAPLLALWE